MFKINLILNLTSDKIVIDLVYPLKLSENLIFLLNGYEPKLMAVFLFYYLDYRFYVTNINEPFILFDKI